jgi:hypothetical protein
MRLLVALVARDGGGPDWWEILLGSGVLLTVLPWIGSWIRAWWRRMRFEFVLEGDLAGAAAISVANRSATPATLGEVKIVVRKNALYRALYFLLRGRRFDALVLAKDSRDKVLEQNKPEKIRLRWGRDERPLPPDRPWRRKLVKRRWRQNEIRVGLSITPRRFSGYHKLEWREGRLQ